MARANSPQVQRAWKENILFDRFEIRDTLDHYSDISDVGDYEVFTIFVSNLHDHEADIQVMAHRLPSRLGAVNVGSSFPVAAGAQEAKTWSMEDVFLPYVLVKASYAVAPSKGDLTVYCIKKRKANKL